MSGVSVGVVRPDMSGIRFFVELLRKIMCRCVKKCNFVVRFSTNTMTDNIDKDIAPARNESPEQSEGVVESPGSYRSPAMAWISVVLALLAWAMLMWVNGYVAMVVAVLAAVVGFMSLPGRSRAVKSLAITAVIASLVLVVVLAAFLVVIKVGLS